MRTNKNVCRFTKNKKIMLAQRVMLLIDSHLEGVDNDNRWIDGEIDADDIGATIKYTVEKKVLSPAFAGDREYPPHGEHSVFILRSVEVEFIDDYGDLDPETTKAVSAELQQYIGFRI